MASTEAARGARLAPLARSVRVGFEFASGWLRWGASWAYLCGVLAALPVSVGLTSLTHAVAGWLIAVPLFGAFWVPLLSVSVSPARDRRNQAQVALALAAAVVLGALVGPGVAALIALSAAVVGLAWLVTGVAPGPTGAARSAFEIFLPACIGWLAVSGPATVPASMAAANGTTWAVAEWLGANAAVLLVFAAFTVVHHGATTALRRRDLSHRTWEIVLGYAAAAITLAAGSHALAAAIVAVLFAVSWPYLAAMRSGRVVWHLRHAQWLAMLSMLAACIAV